MPTRNDDFDWLYRREPSAPQQPPPEPTRVMPAPPPIAARQPAPAPPPAGYPAMPAYGQPPPGGIPPAGPVAPPPRPKRRRRPVRSFARRLVVLLLLILAWLIGVPAYAWSHVGRVDESPSGSRPDNQPGMTFLLVGSDSREGLSKAEQKRLGTGSTAGRRTDTIMVVYVPNAGKPVLISLPRDSYLPIPGHGQNRINASYAFGGPKLLVQTVEQSTGLRIDGYLEIGFGGFVNIIDSLGGIRMCLPNAIKDRDSHLDLPKGCQTLGGVNALGYVRMRKADPRGDLGRVERQRQMLAAVAKKGVSPATIANPYRYWNFCNATTDALRVGKDTSMLEVARAGLAMRTVAAGGGLTLTVPIANAGASTAVGSAVLWDTARAKAMFGEIAAGDTSKLKKYSS